jgi:hypothetical protein
MALFSGIILEHLPGSNSCRRNQTQDFILLLIMEELEWAFDYPTYSELGMNVCEVVGVSSFIRPTS